MWCRDGGLGMLEIRVCVQRVGLRALWSFSPAPFVIREGPAFYGASHLVALHLQDISGCTAQLGRPGSPWGR